MILISRSVQLEFASKVTEAIHSNGDMVPFRKDPYYNGWIIFNEIIGVMSVYSVNLMYALSSMTWLMVASKVDFNTRDESDRNDDDEEEEQKKRDHRFYVRLRMALLYFFIPALMLVSVSGKLKYS